MSTPMTKAGAKLRYLGHGELQIYDAAGPMSRSVRAAVYLAFELGLPLLTVLPDETSADGEFVLFVFERDSGDACLRLTLDGDQLLEMDIGPVRRTGEYHLYWQRGLEHMA